MILSTPALSRLSNASSGREPSKAFPFPAFKAIPKTFVQTPRSVCCWNMAQGLQTNCFCGSSFSTTSAKLCLGSSGRTGRIKWWNDQHFIQVKLSPRCRISRTGSWRSCQVLIYGTSYERLLLISTRKSFTSRFDFSLAAKSTGEDRERNLQVALKEDVFKRLQPLQCVALAGLFALTLLIIEPANAVDSLKTCACLLRECRVELVKCFSNPLCAANVACLQTCNDHPDETECQIKCGDLFENNVVDEFNECAVSRKKCVPRKSDVGEFPVPSPSVLVKNFNISDFSGKWYITGGLNPTFDTFDCQLHEFHVDSGKLIGNISWRIRTPDGGFFTRSTVQKFVQDPMQPGILYNHDNEYLHYQDDWYILSSKVENKPDDYIFVYYRGRNDAWDGYGGAVIYTRSSTLPETIVPKLRNAAKEVGRDFDQFIVTDNTCGPEPPLVERLEKTVEAGEKTIIREVVQIEDEVVKVGKTELSLFEKLANGVRRDVENFLRGLSQEEMELLNDLKMEATELENLFGRSLPLRKLR